MARTSSSVFKQQQSIIYAWRGGEGAASISAQEAGETLASIEQKYGSLQPRVVVKEAENPKHIFHDEFEWDNNICGEKYRIDQARKLIGSVYVVQVAEKKPAQPIRAFVNLKATKEEERHYESIVTVLSDAKKRGQLLRQGWAELKSWERRYSNLDEFAEVFSAIRQLEPVE